VVTWEEGVVGGNMRYTVVVDHREGDPRDGEFNVDLRFKAAGAGGVPHAATENHAMVIIGTIDVPEGDQYFTYQPPNPYVSVKVMQVSPARGVDVTVSPNYQCGFPADVLKYTIFITNMGDVDDDFSLEATDTAGWHLTLSSTSLAIPAKSNKPVKLSVSIPSNAAYSTTDNILVTVRSKTDAAVKASASCIARVGSRKVKVFVSPQEQRGGPGETLNYYITVSNAGDVPDEYILTASDALGWKLMLAENLISVPAGESLATTLNVDIPIDIGQVKNSINIVVTSLSDSSVRASASCEAHVTTVKGGVELLASPTSLRGMPGGRLSYNIVVRNTGTVSDTYVFSATSARGWPVQVVPEILTMEPGENNQIVLLLSIPQGARDGDIEEVFVKAISQTDPAVNSAIKCEAIVEAKRSSAIFAVLALLAAIGCVAGISFLLRKRLVRPRKRGGVLRPI
jgi:uncharacterized membrane protein